MDKKSAALRYGAATGSTGLLGFATYTAYREATDQDNPDLKKVVVASAVLVALAWIAALA